MSDTTGLLREPWENFERQRGAGKFGIWVFLASEVLFFGALMLTYTVCRIDHPDGLRRRRARNQYLVRHDQYGNSPDQQPHNGGRLAGGGRRPRFSPSGHMRAWRRPLRSDWPSWW